MIVSRYDIPVFSLNLVIFSEQDIYICWLINPLLGFYRYTEIIFSFFPYYSPGTLATHGQVGCGTYCMNHTPVMLGYLYTTRETPWPSSTFLDVFLMHDFFPPGLSSLWRKLFEMRTLVSGRTLLYIVM